MTGRQKLAAAFDRWVMLNKWNQAEVAAMGGPSTTTQTKVRMTEDPLSAATLKQVDVVMGWALGTAAQVVAGIIEPPEPSRGNPGPSEEELVRRLADLLQRVDSSREPTQPAKSNARKFESPSAAVRRSLLGKPGDDADFDWWFDEIERRLVALEVLAGLRPKPRALEESEVFALRNTIVHDPGRAQDVEPAALRVLADYAADPDRLPPGQDARARLLYAYAQLPMASAFLADEIIRRFGDLDPDVDPSRPVADLAHPIPGEVTVELSGLDPETTSGDRRPRQGRSR